MQGLKIFSAVVCSLVVTAALPEGNELVQLMKQQNMILGKILEALQNGEPEANVDKNPWGHLYGSGREEQKYEIEADSNSAEDQLPDELLKTYGARKGPGNQLHLTIPGNAGGGGDNVFKFNIKDLVEA